VVPVNDRPVYALFFGALAAGTIAAAAILSTPSWHASTPMTFIALQLGVPAVTLFGAYPISNANWKILRANSWYFIGATLVWIVDTVVAVATLHPPSGYAQQLMDITKMLALAGFANYFFATDSRRTAILIACALILALLPTHIAEIFRTPFKFLKYGDFSASIYLKDPAFATRLQQQKCANFSFNHNVLTAEVLDSIGGEYIMRCNLRTHSVLVRIPKSDGIIVSEWVK
jgi:hypothetical protein